MPLSSACIAAVAQSGITLGNGNRHWFENWDAVDEILLARIPWGDTSALALVISIGGGERNIAVYQAQAIWSDLLEAIQHYLPVVMPEELWERALTASNRGVFIYSRGRSRRMALH